MGGVRDGRNDGTIEVKTEWMGHIRGKGGIKEGNGMKINISLRTSLSDYYTFGRRFK